MNLAGSNNPFYGKKHTEATRRLMSLKKKGKPNGCLGTKRSLESRMKMRAKALLRLTKGPNHYNWKGGITPLKKAIRESHKYRLWRSDVFTRDDFTCTICGKRGGYIEADHYPLMFIEVMEMNAIKSLEEANTCDELWNINNGRTLCQECHRKHGRYVRR